MSEHGEHVLLRPVPFELDADELARLAHVRPGTEDAEAFARLVRQTAAVARPGAVYHEVGVEVSGGPRVRLGAAEFVSAALASNLASVHRCFAYVASCGPEVDDVPLPPDDPLAEFWLDTIKASLLMQAWRHLDEHLRRTYRLGHIATMNPGSADVETWPIEQQRELFDLLGDVKGSLGVTLTDSFLMIPNKTVSGVVFETESDFRSCQVCRREQCPGRSAPFDPELWKQLRHPECATHGE